MKTKVILIIVFLLGMTVFLYPILSNWYNSQAHYVVINESRESMQNLSGMELQAERAKAEAYNANVQSLGAPIMDPFSEDYVEDEAYSSYYDALNLGESMGDIEIPAIDVSLPIYHGASDEVLQQGVGHLSNTSLPIGGDGTHSVLTGHRGLPSAKLFRELDEVREGDKFFIRTLDETLAYEVHDIQVVLPHETDWLVYEEGRDLVTLITCDPYMINTHRILVHSHRIPYAGLDHQQNQLAGPSGFYTMDSNQNYIFYILGGIVAIGTVGTLIYLRRRRRNGGEVD